MSLFIAFHHLVNKSKGFSRDVLMSCVTKHSIIDDIMIGKERSGDGADEKYFWEYLTV